MIEDSKDLIKLRGDFKAYYDNKLHQAFADLEADRKKYLRNFWMLFFVTVVILPAFITFCAATFWQHFINHADADSYMAPVMIFTIIVIILILQAPAHFYKAKVKGRVMQPLIGFFGDFEYRFKAATSEHIKEHSKIFPSFDSFDGDDFFTGKYKEVGITISEEKLTKTVRTQKGSHNVTVFDGVIILLELGKPFKGQIVVKKDQGWVLNRLNGASQNKRVCLEDVKFEKMFEVWADDQIEARYILTTAFMERMIRVKEAFKGNDIEFSFFDNNLMIKLSKKENLFEPASIFSSSTDYKRIEKVFDQFYAVFSVVEMLKLAKNYPVNGEKA